MKDQIYGCRRCRTGYHMIMTGSFIALIYAMTHAVTFAAEIHVAPNGSDTNPGTVDKPFASLEKARDTARTTGGKNIVFVSGTIRLTKTFELNEKDSGTTFKGQADARICGSVAIPNTAVKPVTDNATLGRLVPEVRGKVLEIDLHALGIKDFGEIGPRGFRRPYIPAPLELFVDDEPMRIAQWPNPGQPGESIGKVIDKGPVTRNGEKPTRGGVFTFKTNRPERWTQADDVWISGVFSMGWTDNTVKVKAFNLTKKTLTTVHPEMYGFRSGRRWVALNLLEEIDQPGEFVADKKTGRLYFLPPKGKDIASCRLEVTIMNAPLVAIEGATGVVFDGISFENSRGMGVYIERGANNRIQNGTLRNLGMVAVCVGKGVSPDPDYRHAFTGQPVARVLGSWHEHVYDNPAFNREAGTEHGIVNCEIYNIGAGAISLGGGDRVKLIPAGNFVENCHIHHFNRWDRTYKGAINIDGVGNRISHCHIHDAPALAIYLHGNDHVIEYNDVHHVMLHSDDMGAFYMGRDPTERGNVIRYNYWHDLAIGRQAFGLYFDDLGGNRTEIYGNVFRNAGSAYSVFVNRGRDVTIRDNLFVDCSSTAVALHSRPGTNDSLADTNKLFKERMEAVNYRQPPWSTRDPDLANYDFTINGVGVNVVSERNLFVNCVRKPTVSYKLLPLSYRNSRSLTTAEAKLLFVDLTNGNFALKPGADTGIVGFEPIPFEKIGLKE